MVQTLRLAVLVVVVVGKMELNQHQELLVLQELLVKDMVVEMEQIQEHHDMEEAAVAVLVVLVEMDQALLVDLVELEFKFHQHLEIQYHNQDQEQLQYLVVDWEHLDQEVLISGLLAVAAAAFIMELTQIQ
jgi:hypothetical protein